MTLYRAVFAAEDVEVTQETAEDGREMGLIKALVSKYDVEYRIGWRLWHTIKAGAFAEYAGKPVPLFWQHAWDWSEQTPIGIATADETSDGLVIAGQLWLDTPQGLAVWRSNKAGALTEWSIGYGVKEALKRDSNDDEDHFDVTKGELLEASSVLRGANPKTRTLQTASEPPTPPTESTPEEEPMVEGAERLLERADFRDILRQGFEPADGDET